ncbi:MAG: DUF2130 domain-containing protein [Saprospiraceae bacterium]|nr:DUF2130 domain-containing protein [Saprospiraceae bacterium]
MKKELDFLPTETAGVNCPSCGTPVDIESVLEAQIERRMEYKYASRYAKAKEDLQEKSALLERERMDVKQLSSQTWEIIQEKLKKEKIRLARQLEERLSAEKENEVKQLLLRLEEQKRKNRKVSELEIQLLKREQELDTIREEESLRAQKLLLENQRAVESHIRTQMQERMELQKIEYEKRLADQKKLVETMGQKIDQGSMKMQGEVQELAIESYLLQHYPMDKVLEIRSGARGGDCILMVHDAMRKDAGSIYIESKRTKTFQRAWITKFRQDMLTHKADVGVIVTKTMPVGEEGLTQIDGVWICSFRQFKLLVPVLRSSLLRFASLRKQLDNSQDKMGLLYNYLVSNEFRMQVESIIKGFTNLREDLDKEKRAMHAIWNKREKQLERVILNTAGMYGSIQGLAGGEVQDIEALHFKNLNGPV